MDDSYVPGTVCLVAVTDGGGERDPERIADKIRSPLFAAPSADGGSGRVFLFPRRRHIGRSRSGGQVHQEKRRPAHHRGAGSKKKDVYLSGVKGGGAPVPDLATGVFPLRPESPAR